MSAAPLAGRHAFVLGASQGIGEAVARRLAAQGATLTLAARSVARLREVAASLHGLAPVHVLPLDLDDLPTTDAALQGHLDAHGPMTILVHNTGGPASGPLLDATDVALLGAFSRHVLSLHHVLRALLPGMRHAGWGRIVTILSTSVREPIPNLGVSNTVRAAVAAYTKTLSLELPPGVNINNVLPGFTRTERLAVLRTQAAARSGSTEDAVERHWLSQVPEGRIAEADEVAAVVAFLCGPDSSFVRGQSWAADGGRIRAT